MALRMCAYAMTTFVCVCQNITMIPFYGNRMVNDYKRIDWLKWSHCQLMRSCESSRNECHEYDLWHKTFVMIYWISCIAKWWSVLMAVDKRWIRMNTSGDLSFRGDTARRNDRWLILSMSQPMILKAYIVATNVLQGLSGDPNASIWCMDTSRPQVQAWCLYKLSDLFSVRAIYWHMKVSVQLQSSSRSTTCWNIVMNESSSQDELTDAKVIWASGTNWWSWRSLNLVLYDTLMANMTTPKYDTYYCM